MARNGKNFIPTYRHHKPSNQGIVEFSGRRIYLGDSDNPATQEAYHRLIAEWLANGKKLPVEPGVITVVELCNAYWKWCVRTYPPKNGKISSTAHRTKSVIRELRLVYGRTHVSDFSPKSLIVVRSNWVRRGMVRRTVNEYAAIVKRILRWGVAEGMVSSSVYHGLTAVEGLRRGRTEALESTPVRPAPQEHIDAIEPFVSRQVWALVKLQLLTGARGGELVALRPVDLDTSGDIWEVTLNHHKTANTGHTRSLYFGPKAQVILKQFLTDRPLDAYLFSSIEARNELRRRRKKSTHGSSRINPHEKRSIRDKCYTPDSYRQAIVRACKQADITCWTPHRLRHNVGTLIRKEHGLDVAQIILGHASADVTQLYAEVDRQKAMNVLQEIG